jgi:hypothetical protein
MISKFNDYLKESIRDKMYPVDKDQTNKILNDILSGENNVDIIINYLDFVYGKDKYYFSRQDIYYDFASLLPKDFIYMNTIKLLPDIEKKNFKLVKDIFTWIFHKIRDNYKYIDYLENLINSYDSNEFKKIVINKLNNKLNIDL